MSNEAAPSPAADPVATDEADHGISPGRDVDADTSDAIGSEPDTASHDEELDLAAIESDLDDVQAALTRLADGTYWTDEVTGEPIPADVLANTPLTRRS
ncbi:MAG: hypothetical protein AB8G14_14280 [Ilumatobacter sp.]